jgi:NAD(P)H-dependent nitrite reductase small subunit
VGDIPAGGGVAVRHGQVQLAVFRHESGGLYATQNMCPHKQDLVLSRGLLGETGGVPKVACPQHKKTFSLLDGSCLSGGAPAIRTFPVKVENGDVWIELPPPQQLEAELCPGSSSCAPHAAVGA